jgi:hypothetical protein
VPSPSDTTPPASPEKPKGTYGEVWSDKFQQRCLAVLARVPAVALKYRSALHHNYFVSNVRRVIAKALLAYIDKYRELPSADTLLVTVSEITDEETAKKCQEEIDYAYTLDLSDVVGVTDRIIEFGRQQAMENAVIEAADMLGKGKRDITPVIRKAELVGQDLTNIGIEYRTAPRLPWYDPELEDDRIPTGMPHLDKALGGGMLRGGLYVYLGPPKRGKSIALVNTGFGPLLSLDKYNVAHYTLEMSQKRVGIRYDMRLAGKHWQLRKSDPEKFAAVMQERAATLLTGNLFIQGYSTRTAGVGMLRGHLALLASAHGFYPDMIVVDYADIMKAESRLGEMRHEQAGIYEDLRGLGGEKNAVVVTASQAKKEALEKETPDMGDFAEAFEKAAIMDAGIAVCQSQQERALGKGRFFMMGMRDEEDGTTVEFKIDRRRQLIQTVALYSPSGVRVPSPGDSDDVPVSMPSQYVPKQAKSLVPPPKPNGGAVTKKFQPPGPSSKPSKTIAPGTVIKPAAPKPAAKG